MVVCFVPETLILMGAAPLPASTRLPPAWSIVAQHHTEDEDIERKVDVLRHRNRLSKPDIDASQDPVLDQYPHPASLLQSAANTPCMCDVKLIEKTIILDHNHFEPPIIIVIDPDNLYDHSLFDDDPPSQFGF